MSKYNRYYGHSYELRNAAYDILKYISQTTDPQDPNKYRWAPKDSREFNQYEYTYKLMLALDECSTLWYESDHCHASYTCPWESYFGLFYLNLRDVTDQTRSFVFNSLEDIREDKPSRTFEEFLGFDKINPLEPPGGFPVNFDQQDLFDFVTGQTDEEDKPQ